MSKIDHDDNDTVVLMRDNTRNLLTFDLVQGVIPPKAFNSIESKFSLPYHHCGPHFVHVSFIITSLQMEVMPGEDTGRRKLDRS